MDGGHAVPPGLATPARVGRKLVKSLGELQHHLASLWLATECCGEPSTRRRNTRKKLQIRLFSRPAWPRAIGIFNAPYVQDARGLPRSSSNSLIQERPRHRNATGHGSWSTWLGSESWPALEHFTSRDDDMLDGVAPELVAEQPLVAVSEQDQVRARPGGESAAIGETEQLCRATFA